MFLQLHLMSKMEDLQDFDCLDFHKEAVVALDGRLK